MELLATPADVQHFNPEHAVSDANSEFRGAANVSVFGTKSEGTSPTIWVRNCTNVWHYGHGGNAHPKSQVELVARPPSLFRVEDCADCRFANAWTYRKQFPGFTSIWVNNSGVPPVATPAMDCPVLVVSSAAIGCQANGTTLHCHQLSGRKPTLHD